MSDESVKKWSACFRAGRESLVDDPRLDRTNSVITADLIGKVDDLVRCDCHVILRMLVEKMDVSFLTVFTIVHDRLRNRKVCGNWVPKQVSG